MFFFPQSSCIKCNQFPSAPKHTPTALEQSTFQPLPPAQGLLQTKNITSWHVYLGPTVIGSEITYGAPGLVRHANDSTFHRSYQETCSDRVIVSLIPKVPSDQSETCKVWDLTMMHHYEIKETSCQSEVRKVTKTAGANFHMSYHS